MGKITRYYHILKSLDDWAQFPPSDYPAIGKGAAEAAKAIRELQSKAGTQEPPPPSWSPSWPTEPGWYWFYGKASENAEVRGPNLAMAYTADAFLHVSLMRGYHIRQDLGATGLWLPLQTPEVPEEVKM